MGLFERMLGNLTRGGLGGHHRDRHGSYETGNFGKSHGGISCPKCGNANSNTARFCQQCGTTLSTSVCTGCGAEMSAGARFCNQCGKDRK